MNLDEELPLALHYQVSPRIILDLAFLKIARLNMTRKPIFAVVVVSLILLAYCALILFNLSLPVAYFIFSISPLLLAWVAYTIIRFGVYKGREFKSDEEWGYQDNKKEDLDIL